MIVLRIYNFFCYICSVKEMEGRKGLLFCCNELPFAGPKDSFMDKTRFTDVASEAAKQRDCEIAELLYNDDDNVFELVLRKEGGSVDLQDCESVHRAILAAFDRNVEDYALTVGSEGLSSEEADRLLGEIDE